MHGDSREVGAAHFAFACMDTGAHVKLKFVCRCDDCLGASDGPRGAVEGGEEAVSTGAYLASAEGVELGADHCIMTIERSAPGVVALPCREGGRSNDVCEEHGGEHSGVEGMRSSTRNEFFDHVSKFKCVSAYRLCSRCEYEARSSNVLSQILRRRSEHGVVGRAKYERWCLNEREDIAYVSLVNRETRNGG